MAQEDVAPIRVGLLGAGTVGSQTARLLVEQKDELAARIGRPIELTGVACLDPVETDPFPWIDKAIVTTDTMSVATNSDIVIELIGGTGVARKFVLAAIESGASVVTANKALLAKYGPEIYAAAEAKGVDIYFEASVGGAIPFLKPLRESLVGDKVTSMLGIVNGTTNYILDEMTTKGEVYRIKHIDRGIFAEGLGCVISAFFGGLPCTSYTQNIGIISATGVCSRRVTQIAGVIFLAYGLCPKLAYILSGIPRSVIGAVFLISAATIMFSGIDSIISDKRSLRNTLVAGTTLALAIMLPYHCASTYSAWAKSLPAFLNMLCTSTVFIAVVAGVLLNLILNYVLKDKNEK